MIQPGSKIKVADNTGAKEIECIRVLSKTRYGFATVGNVITASVKDALPRGAVKKKTVVRAVLIRSKYGILRSDGSKISFDENAAVILDDDGNLKGSRVFGPVPRELRQKYPKIISLSPEVL